MAEIKKLDSKVVYKNKWMTVREDEIQRASGAKSIYGVVDKSNFVVIVPVENGRIHLVEQYRYPVGERYWEFPQGSWEGELNADPKDVALGELKEETGLIANNIEPVSFLYQGYGYSSQGYNIYFATDFTKSEMELDEEEEGLITASFSIQEFEDMLLNGQIKDATTTAAYGLAKLKGFV
ncbi:MAG: NUDIX domain-containing protein [Jejuia sp.]